MGGVAENNNWERTELSDDSEAISSKYYLHSSCDTIFDIIFIVFSLFCAVCPPSARGLFICIVGSIFFSFRHCRCFKSSASICIEHISI